MYRKYSAILVTACITSLLASVPFRAKAQLGGTKVTGGIYFNYYGSTFSPNGYDPANGNVPTAGSPENMAGTTVAISDSALEFAFLDGYNYDTADFTDSTLTISDSVGTNGALPWRQTFTDPAFNGFLAKVSDTFDDGGVTASILGDTITLNWGGSAPDNVYTAVFDVGSVLQVPEPSTWALVAGGALLAAFARRRLAR